MSLLVPLLLLALSIPLVLAIVRANELFCIRARGGEVRVLRGRIPQALLDDVVEIVRTGTARVVVIRAVAEDRRPRVYVEGELSDQQRQRLRNVVGLWSVAKLRAAPRGR